MQTNINNTFYNCYNYLNISTTVNNLTKNVTHRLVKVALARLLADKVCGTPSMLDSAISYLFIKEQNILKLDMKLTKYALIMYY